MSIRGQRWAAARRAELSLAAQQHEGLIKRPALPKAKAKAKGKGHGKGKAKAKAKAKGKGNGKGRGGN